MITQLLVPAWRAEKESLLAAPTRANDEKEDATPVKPPQAKDEHIRNAEEFARLNIPGIYPERSGAIEDDGRYDYGAVGGRYHCDVHVSL